MHCRFLGVLRNRDVVPFMGSGAITLLLRQLPLLRAVNVFSVRFDFLLAMLCRVRLLVTRPRVKLLTYPFQCHTGPQFKWCALYSEALPS